MNIKKCKHCGTIDNLIITKTGVIWGICTSCNSIRSTNSHKGKKLSEKHKENISIGGKGKKHSEATKILISEKRKGMKFTDAHIYNMSEVRKGKIHTEDHRRKNSEGVKRSMTKERREAISNASKRENRSEQTLQKVSETLKFRLQDYQEKYPSFCLMEEIRENINPEIGKASIQVKCKKCNDWFTPLVNSVHNRIRSLENNKDNAYFYCSDECKNSCPLFGVHIDQFINNLYRSESGINDSDYAIWRKEVLNRQLREEDVCYNHCEKCESEVNLHVHHEKPQKTHPHLAIDPDNGIIMCNICHYKYGHADGCNTKNLANIICN